MSALSNWSNLLVKGIPGGLRTMLLMASITFLSPLNTLTNGIQPDAPIVLRQWEVFEKTLISTNSYSNSQKYKDVTLTATFRGPGGTFYTVPGFWDGGDMWRLRFSPTKPGVWTYTVVSSDDQLNAKLNDGFFIAIDARATDISENANYRGFLKVSANGRYFTYSDGTPFFWLGGTIWDGNSENMPLPDFKTYVDDRKQKGFTAIQILVGEPEQRCPEPRRTGCNENGPLFTKQYSEISPANLQAFDERIEYIVESGLIPVIFLTWSSGFQNMSIVDLENYTRYLVARYQAYNVLWVVSGEYGFYDIKSKYRQIGNYLNEIDTLGHLTSIHPVPRGPMGSYSSTEDFWGEAWVDFYMHQTWNRGSTRDTMARDYVRVPAVPAVQAESGYDGLWTYNRSKVRNDAWTHFFSGGAGYTYGAHGVWNWNNGWYTAAPDDCCADKPPQWSDAIDLPSSRDMKHLADFFISIEWWKLSPDDSVVSAGYALVEQGSQYAIWVPAAEETVSLDLTDTSNYFSVEWFSPVNGTYISDDYVIGGTIYSLTTPFEEEAVLYLKACASPLIQLVE